jgi:hypothetical protein
MGYRGPISEQFPSSAPQEETTMADVKSFTAFHKLQTLGLSPQGATEVVMGRPLSVANDRTRLLKLAQVARTGTHALLNGIAMADDLARTWPFIAFLPGGEILNVEELHWPRQKVYYSDSVQADPVLRRTLERAGWSGRPSPTAKERLLIDVRSLEAGQYQGV